MRNLYLFFILLSFHSFGNAASCADVTGAYLLNGSTNAGYCSSNYAYAQPFICGDNCWGHWNNPCSANESWDFDQQQCVASNPTDPPGTQTNGSWNGGNHPPGVVDENGDYWQNNDSVCDAGSGQCVGTFEKTGENYDYNDPSTWPDGAVGQSNNNNQYDPNYQNFSNPDSLEGNPFAPDQTGNVNNGLTTHNKDETINNPDGSTTNNSTTENLHPDGTKDKTTTSETTNPDGSKTKTTTTQTTTPDGTKTTSTTETITDTQGNETTTIVGTSTEQGEEDSKNKASGGGGCDGPPLCDGDPILCAMLQQDYEQKCMLVGSITQGQLGVTDSIASLESSVDLSSQIAGVFADNGASTSCPSSHALNIMGTTINFTFQPFCDVMISVRPLVLFIFSLIGFRVIMEAF